MSFHEDSDLLLLSRKGPGCMVQLGVTGGTNLMARIVLGHICDLPNFALVAMLIFIPRNTIFVYVIPDD